MELGLATAVTPHFLVSWRQHPILLGACQT